jgi:VWFA-related protein
MKGACLESRSGLRRMLQMKAMRTTFPAVLTLAALAGPAMFAQQPRPPGQQPPPPITFKVEVNYVEIDASVTDQQGNFVRDLTRDDFELSEQGKPQSVSVFSLVDIPIARFDPPLFKTKPIEPDVRSNRHEFDGRIFVIVLDDLNTNFARTARVKAAARQFIERYLGANDLAAVIPTGGRTTGGQEFTSSRERLLRAVDTFMGQKERSATLEKIDDYYRSRDLGTGALPRDPIEALRVFKARNTYATLKNVADYLNGIRGRRKAVVLFSEGVEYDTYDQINNTYAADIRDASRDAIAAATRANVSIYSVDPRGLAGFEDAAEIGSLPDDPSLGLGTLALQREMELSQDSLRVLSNETGGFAAVNRNDFSTSFARIIQDNSSYYVLGYYSNDTRRDGQFRGVNVRVKRPGLEVRARKGYVAPRGRPPAGTPPPSLKASAEMRDALNSPIAVSGLPMSVVAAPLLGAKPNASVLVALEVEGSRLKFKDEGGTFSNDIEVVIMAADEKAKIRDGARDVAQLRLKADTHAAVMRYGVRILRRLALPPGRYQLRIGARESGGGLVGSVLYDLDVPDFTKEPLAMSGLLIASRAAARIPTAANDPEFKEILPSPPTAVRIFPVGDALTVASDVYDNRISTPHRVEIKTTVTADDGKVVFTSTDERKTDELKGAGTFGHVATIPLTGVAPGRYVLKVDARVLLSNGDTASREVEFLVR